MPDSDSKKDLTQEIRKSLKSRVDLVIGNAFRPELESEAYLPEIADLPELIFAQNLVKVGGKFSYCINKNELVSNLSQLFQNEKWESVFVPEEHLKIFLDMAGAQSFSDPANIKSMQVAVTACEFLIARTGSVMVSSAQVKGRRIFGFAPIHIVIAYTSQLVNEIKEAIQGMKTNYTKLPSLVTTITGPSRTADIEKTLVQGMHGPEELYVFLVNDK